MDDKSYNDFTGYLSHQTTVWCGGCQKWEMASSIGAAKEFKRVGWRNTKTYGWLCPDCVKRLVPDASKKERDGK